MKKKGAEAGRENDVPGEKIAKTNLFYKAEGTAPGPLFKTWLGSR